jgi:hypothetical protein
VMERMKSSPRRPKWRPRWALERMITDKQRATTATSVPRFRSDLARAAPQRRRRMTGGPIANSDCIVTMT